MKRRDRDRLQDVLKAADLVAAFTEGFSLDRFLEDTLVQSAVLHQLQIVGEATRHISEAFKAAHPEIPWPRIVGMRHVIVHGYNEVELEVVWSVVEKFLPDTAEMVAAALKTLGE